MNTERAERPEKVVCQVCSGHFNLLHRSHLRVHGYNSQAEYRAEFGIDPKIPLNSQEYSEVRRMSQQKPENWQRSSDMGKNWGLQRRLSLALLERDNFYTPSRASEITQIPLQTIYSAIRREALPSAKVCLLINTGDRIVSSGDRIIQGINLEDMTQFAKQHKPKYPRKMNPESTNMKVVSLGLYRDPNQIE